MAPRKNTQQRSSRRPQSGKKLEHMRQIGGKVNPPSQPPMVQLAHWNAATIVKRSSGDVELTVNDLCNELRDQHGLFASDTTNRIPIMIRFMSFHFWLLDAVLPSAFQVLIRDTVNFGEMARLSDFPARNQWARVGWVWPLSDQVKPHLHSDEANKPLKIDVTSSAAWIFHLHVLWRPLNGQSYTDAFREPERSASSSFCTP